MTPDEYIKILKDNGIHLLEFQKILLKKFIETKHDAIYLVPSRHCGYSYLKTLANTFLEVNNNEN